MNAVRTNIALRIVATAVMLCAWVVLSNHCALSAVFAVKSASVATVEPGCCKNQPQPGDHDGSCPQLPQGCCKTLKVAMPDAMKIAHASLALVDPNVAAWIVDFTVLLTGECSAATDPGPPPDVPGFAWLVLNQSLLSHAPPSIE